MICIFVAYSKNRVIGKANELPWYIPEDLKRFRQLTTGRTVIMGKNTYNSIVARLGHALPNRRNIVISSSLPPSDGFEVTRSLEQALSLAQNDEQVFIIGGERVYRDSLKMGVVDKIYATEVHKIIDGDVFFPEITQGQWIEESREERKAIKERPLAFAFVTIKRLK